MPLEYRLHEHLHAQVTSLALCKLSKTEVLLRWLGKARRHEQEERLFWRLDEAPEEALQALQVGVHDSLCSSPT